MSNSEILGMVGLLLVYAMVGLGVLVGACLLANHVAYRVEDYYARRRARRCRGDVAERSNVYRLHPGEVVPFPSSERDDAA